MTAWPGFPPTYFIGSEWDSQRLKISFIWKRLCWKCRTNKKGPEGGTATKSWTSQRGSSSDVNTVTDLCANMSFVKTKSKIKWLWMDFLLHITLKRSLLSDHFIVSFLLSENLQLFSLNGSNHTIIPQTSHWIAWLCCYLKRISMPRWCLWPLLCKTANRWNRWVAAWYFCRRQLTSSEWSPFYYAANHHTLTT